MSDVEAREITTRCPSCGCQTLFIGTGGHLTCSLIDCQCPSVASKIAELQAKAHRYDAIVNVVRRDE